MRTVVANDGSSVRIVFDEWPNKQDVKMSVTIGVNGGNVFEVKAGH